MAGVAWLQRNRFKREKRSLRVRLIGDTHNDLRLAASLLSGFQ